MSKAKLVGKLLGTAGRVAQAQHGELSHTEQRRLLWLLRRSYLSLSQKMELAGLQARRRATTNLTGALDTVKQARLRALLSRPRLSPAEKAELGDLRAEHTEAVRGRENHFRARLFGKRSPKSSRW